MRFLHKVKMQCLWDLKHEWDMKVSYRNFNASIQNEYATEVFSKMFSSSNVNSTAQFYSQFNMEICLIQRIPYENSVCIM